MKSRTIALISIFLVMGMISQSHGQPEKAEPNTPPTGFLDGVRYENGFFYASGWAADKEDGSPIKEVQVFVDNKIVGKAKLGIDRPGVATVMKNPKWDRSGWEISVKLPLDKGSHTSYAVAVNKRDAKARLNHEMKFNVE